MTTPSGGTDTGASEPLTLEAVARARGAGFRDCRDCQHHEPQDDLAYGWCKAHAQFVKHYHPAGQFWSQCQFKSLARERRP